MARLGYLPRFDEPLRPPRRVTCEKCGTELRADDLDYHVDSPECVVQRAPLIAPECESCGAPVERAGVWCWRCDGRSAA